MTPPIVSVDPNAPRIIPLPRDWQIQEGLYELPQQVTIGYQGDGAGDIARWLSGTPNNPELKSCLLADFQRISCVVQCLDQVIRTRST